MLKVRTLLLALMASLVLSSMAVADDVSLFTLSNGVESTEHYVPLKKAKKLPQWQPLSNQEPPLSLRKAIAIALREVKSKNPKRVRWELYSVEMRREKSYDIFNHKDYKFDIKDYDFWYYNIDLSSSDNTSGATLLVLMDGSIANTRKFKSTVTKRSR